jgi:hypothetical protein
VRQPLNRSKRGKPIVIFSYSFSRLLKVEGTVAPDSDKHGTDATAGQSRYIILDVSYDPDPLPPHVGRHMLSLHSPSRVQVALPSGQRIESPSHSLLHRL